MTRRGIVVVSLFAALVCCLCIALLTSSSWAVVGGCNCMQKKEVLASGSGGTYVACSGAECGITYTYPYTIKISCSPEQGYWCLVGYQQTDQHFDCENMPGCNKNCAQVDVHYYIRNYEGGGCKFFGGCKTPVEDENDRQGPYHSNDDAPCQST